jgi:heat shock protein HslJ
MTNVLVKEAMHPGVVSCDSSTTVNEAARMMTSSQLRSLVVVDADCGRVTSAFTASDEALRVDGLSAAELRCGSPSLANEFARDLSYAASYRVQGEQLVINLAMDLGALVFTSGDPASQPAETKMPVQVWQWDGHLSSAGKSITPKNPAQYTFAFDADGGFSFRAECNVGKGAYVANGNQLDMSVGAASTGQCGKGSLSKTFMGLLDDVTGYTVMGDHLYLDVKYDARWAQSPPPTRSWGGCGAGARG